MWCQTSDANLPVGPRLGQLNWGHSLLLTSIEVMYAAVYARPQLLEWDRVCEQTPNDWETSASLEP